MSSPDDSRPLSVAELLAKNGAIGSPPVSGHRRRRRSNSNAVTVAELTGEIPIVRTGEILVVTAAEDEQQFPESSGNSTAEPADEPKVAPPRSADPTAEVDRGPVLSHDPRPHRRSQSLPAHEISEISHAEHMSFDPVDDAGLIPQLSSADHPINDPDLQSYLRSSGGALFGGHTVADDRARRGVTDSAKSRDDAEYRSAVSDTRDVRDVRDPDLGHQDSAKRVGRLSTLTQGALAVLQSILAVACGAGLFLAFDQLWRWNAMVALVLSVLVTLCLVVAVRLVRKTEDITSTLIAVAVAAVITLGPLALQST